MQKTSRSHFGLPGPKSFVSATRLFSTTCFVRFTLSSFSTSLLRMIVIEALSCNEKNCDIVTFGVTNRKTRQCRGGGKLFKRGPAESEHWLPARGPMACA